MNLIKHEQQRIKNECFWKHFLKKSVTRKTKTSWFLIHNYLLWHKDKSKERINYKKNPVIQKRNYFLFNKKGQGLVEYLILIALMGVATIGIVRTLNQTVKSRFANAIYALQGRNQKAKTHTMKKEEYQRSDLSNFMSGSASTDKKTESRKR